MNFLKLFFVLIFFVSGETFGDDNKNTSSNSDEIKFSSDSIEVDEKKKIVTASGNVVIISASEKIEADKVTYNQNSDKAIAIGNVVLTQKDGSIYETDKAILTNEFKSIVAIPLFGKLADKSSISAKKLIRNDLGESFFREGIYTACECDLKKNETPIWRLESKKLNMIQKQKLFILLTL